MLLLIYLLRVLVLLLQRDLEYQKIFLHYLQCRYLNQDRLILLLMKIFLQVLLIYLMQYQQLLLYTMLHRYLLLRILTGQIKPFNLLWKSYASDIFVT